jgi:hypothetical protein
MKEAQNVEGSSSLWEHGSRRPKGASHELSTAWGCIWAGTELNIDRMYAIDVYYGHIYNIDDLRLAFFPRWVSDFDYKFVVLQMHTPIIAMLPFL